MLTLKYFILSDYVHDVMGDCTSQEEKRRQYYLKNQPFVDNM